MESDEESEKNDTTSSEEHDGSPQTFEAEEGGELEVHDDELSDQQGEQHEHQMVELVEGEELGVHDDELSEQQGEQHEHQMVDPVEGEELGVHDDELSEEQEEQYEHQTVDREEDGDFGMHDDQPSEQQAEQHEHQTMPEINWSSLYVDLGSFPYYTAYGTENGFSEASHNSAGYEGHTWDVPVNNVEHEIPEVEDPMPEAPNRTRRRAFWEIDLNGTPESCNKRQKLEYDEGLGESSQVTPEDNLTQIPLELQTNEDEGHWLIAEYNFDPVVGVVCCLCDLPILFGELFNKLNCGHRMHCPCLWRRLERQKYTNKESICNIC